MKSSSIIAKSIHSHIVFGVACVVLIGGGVTAWASYTQLAAAIIAPGQVVVDSAAKKVQHPTGGVVKSIHVREGSKVKAGDVLIRLDETVAQASLAVIANELDELAVAQARNEAEVAGNGDIEYPLPLVLRRREPAIARLMDAARQQLNSGRAVRDGQKAQLRERIAQYREQINGQTKQAVIKGKESELIKVELAGIRELWEKKLIAMSRLTMMERDVLRIDSETAQLRAMTADYTGKIAEIELQIIQIDQDLRRDTSKELERVRSRTSELRERRIAAQDQLDRIEIRAPQGGVVYSLTVHTVGGVISTQGEPIMLIVPEQDVLQVEAKVQPNDVDQLTSGRPVRIRFPGLNQRTTPEIFGTLMLISPDILTDQRTGAPYYKIRIALPDDEKARLKGTVLVPGMPCEAFIETASPRTFVSYMMKPMQDQMSRAFIDRY